jgi:hypothetical protein
MDVTGSGGDPGAQLACCREQMLPIWERWTDGNPAARRLLGGERVDPASREEHFRALMRVVAILRKHTRTASTEAAVKAALACFHARVGGPHERFEWARRRALAADAQARQ